MAIAFYLYYMQLFFPATYSTLCPKALSEFISKTYGFKSVSCHFLVRGVGDTYHVNTDMKKYILRVYRATHRNLAQIREEVNLLTDAHSAGVSVSFPILDLNGASIQKITAAEGDRYAVLFSYAAGMTVRTMNDSQLEALGREMALLHDVSSQKGLHTSRWTFDPYTTLHRPLELLHPVLNENPEGYAWLKTAADKATEFLNHLDSTQFSTGFCHFDFLPKNFHFDTTNKVTLFDFDFMGYGWLVNDLMTFWQHLELDVYTGRMARNDADKAFSVFLDTYRKHRTISEGEVKAIPYLTLGFWLFYMGFHTTHDQFYAFTQAAHVNLYMGFLQHIANKYWM